MGLIRELFDYRTMLATMVRKELVTRYKGSVLGFLWAFVNPLLQLAVYSVVFSSIMRVDVDKYYIYLFVAFIPWFFLSTCLGGGANCVVESANLVKKIYFPRMVIPLSTVTAGFVNLCLSMAVVLGAVLFSGIGLSACCLLLPGIMALEYLLALGFLLIFSALNVYLRDLRHMLEILMMAWFYATPIVYTPDMAPEGWRWALSLNPMTGLVEAYRDLLYYQRLPDISHLLWPFGLALLLCLGGGWLFQRLQRGFAEEL